MIEAEFSHSSDDKYCMLASLSSYLLAIFRKFTLDNGMILQYTECCEKRIFICLENWGTKSILESLRRGGFGW